MPLALVSRLTRPACRRASLALAAAAGLLAGSAPAWADQTNGFGVATSARVSDPYPFIWATSAYRTTGDSSGNYTVPADVPATTSDPCPGIAGSGFTCIATLGGTTGPGHNLTASHSEAALTTSLVANSTTLLSSSAAAQADLGRGTVGVEAATGYRHGAIAFASFGDTLNFQVAGASASTVTLVTVGLTLRGALDVPVGLGSIQVGLGFGSANARVDHLDYGSLYDPYGYELTSAFQQGGWVSHQWRQQTPGLTRFTGVYALTGAEPVAGVGIRVIGYADGHDAGALYRNGATVDLVLPEGVSYTSASGVFLTSAVPEPTNAALLLAGLASLGLVGRRRPRG